MAARLNPSHDLRTREKIQTSQLINRLQSNALGELEKEMSPGQVKSAEILLRKILPDVSATELTGPDGGPVAIQMMELRAVYPKDNAGG